MVVGERTRRTRELELSSGFYFYADALVDGGRAPKNCCTVVCCSVLAVHARSSFLWYVEFKGTQCPTNRARVVTAHATDRRTLSS